MKTAVFLLPFLLLLASPATFPAGAQPAPPVNRRQFTYDEFSPAVVGIIVILTLALVFMTFVSAYIRYLSESPVDAGDARRAHSLRLRREAAARGLDASIIESFPTFSYSEVKDHQIGKGDLECAVCINEFEDDEILRLLPRCNHVFHPECIDAWLFSHVTCPVCRANLSHTPPAEDHLPDCPPPSGDVAVEVVEDNDRSEQPRPPAVAGRSMSMPKAVALGGVEKFRSHSTGHSMVVPGENLERFTLRLPVRVRKEVMDRALSNRMGEGSWSRARFFKRIGRESRSSDRWGFSARASSMRLPTFNCRDSDEPPDQAVILLSSKNIK